ncbi:MAG: hypothetical protein EXR39_05415 [Betaproteobacteria bacterium]|nr:hypothetical protein [Betaproteobacteria bacterium]
MSTANVETWDYTIVGAGAAGCVLANRLTASGRYRVLVLEADGNDNKLWIRVPAGFTRTMFDKRISWGYHNAPGPAIGNRKIPCPRGKVLGGSSSINGHAYVRGQAQDYEDWVAQGATGWGWSDVLPFSNVPRRVSATVIRRCAGPAGRSWSMIRASCIHSQKSICKPCRRRASA